MVSNSVVVGCGFEWGQCGVGDVSGPLFLLPLPLVFSPLVSLHLITHTIPLLLLPLPPFISPPFTLPSSSPLPFLYLASAAPPRSSTNLTAFPAQGRCTYSTHVEVRQVAHNLTATS